MQFESTAICGHCRNPFHVSPSRRAGGAVHCSQDCRNAAMGFSPKQIYTCRNCAGVFLDYASQPHSYCTNTCRLAGFATNHPRRGTSDRKIESICEYCGIAFRHFRHPKSRRWCTREHYQRARAERHAQPGEFDAKVDSSSEIGCWSYLGTHDSAGYGIFNAGARHSRMLAHRYAWEKASGEPIPPGLVVGHICDNPPCARADDVGTYIVRGRELPRFGHLFLGTTADNMHDKADKGRNRNQIGAPYPRLTDATLQMAMVSGVVVALFEIRQLRLGPDGSLKQIAWDA